MDRVRLTALLALLAAAGASIATSRDIPPDVRTPCDGEGAWDPNAPLRIVWGDYGAIPVESANFRNAISVRTAEGFAVPWYPVEVGSGVVHICPEGGWFPNTAYVWEVGPFENRVANQAAVPYFGAPGPLSFRTARSTVLPPLSGPAACAAFSDFDAFDHEVCDTGWWDTGWPEDADGDGFGAWEDCDDDDPAVHPGAEERCDGVDQDCDGDIDEDPDVPPVFPDEDGDGYGTGPGIRACESPQGASEGGDCDDADPTVHPGATELCDGVDQDCDGDLDDGAGAPWFPDADGDGYGGGEPVIACDAPEGHVADGADCDDADPTVHPGATDLPGDGLDFDCDGAD